MIILAEGGSELSAIRTLRLGAADYLPKRLLTPPRLQRSIKLTLRAIDKEAQRRAERLTPASAAGKPMPPRRDARAPGRRRTFLPHTGAASRSAAHRHRDTGETLAAPRGSRLPARPRRAPHVATHTGAAWRTPPGLR